MRFALLAVLLAPMPAVAQPTAPRLAPDSESQWVAFDLTPGNQVRFRLMMNGRPATAILDTGVSYTVASITLATSLGLKAAASGRADAIGGSVPLSWAAVESIGFGGLARSGGRVAVAELKAIATGSAQPVDVLVGADILGHHALDIDYDQRRFRILPTGRMPFRGTSVPLGLSRDSGVFISEITVGAGRLRPLLVDTGDGSAVTLSREAWTATRLPFTGFTSAFAFGLGGSIETDLKVLPQLKLAGFTARNVELRVERRQGFSSQTGTAGRIGSGFLQRYRVLLDPKAKRMILSPGKTADAAPLKSTSGLLVALQGKELRVLHVMRHSPAATQGWQAGERICRIDGQLVPTDYITNPLANWSADTPGRTVKLGICGKGAERALTLANFY